MKEWRGEIVVAALLRTGDQALNVLSAALGKAVEDGLLPANPYIGIRRMPILAATPNALLPSEVERVRVEMPTLQDVVCSG